MDIFSFDSIRWYLDLFSEPKFVSAWIVLLTTTLLLAIPLNYYKYRKDVIKDTQFWCSLCLGISYASTDYIMAALYYSLQGFGTLFPTIKVIFPVYTLFDVITLGIIWLLAVLFRADKHSKIPSSVSFVIMLLGINALLHVYYFWVSLFTQQAGFLFEVCAVIYSVAMNVNDIMLILTMLFFSTMDKFVNKIKNIISVTFGPISGKLLGLFPNGSSSKEV